MSKDHKRRSTDSGYLMADIIMIANNDSRLITDNTISHTFASGLPLSSRETIPTILASKTEEANNAIL